MSVILLKVVKKNQFYYSDVIDPTQTAFAKSVETMFKNSDSIDLTKYPALNLEDINEGLWKDWAFKTEDLIISFFSIDGNNRTYENAPFYERTAMYIIGNVFGTPNYPYDKHLEDVRDDRIFKISKLSVFRNF